MRGADCTVQCISLELLVGVFRRKFFDVGFFVGIRGFSLELRVFLDSLGFFVGSAILKRGFSLDLF